MSAATHPGAARRWLVGPWFDLLALCNVAWPLLLLVGWDQALGRRDELLFWQVYFVTTPHRWMTLILVFADRQRYRERRGTFLGLAFLFAAICCGIRATTGTLTCLLTIDYLWNAWHFAAQHHGIYRIYGRMQTTPSTSISLTIEKWSLRFFLLYVTFRIAGHTWAQPQLEAFLQTCDWLVPIIPVSLLVTDLSRWKSNSPGRVVYLLSLSSLYLAILWSVHTSRPGLVLTLATASALFHAIEYLGLSSWLARRRSSQLGNEAGWISWLAPRWTLTLGLYVVLLGSMSWWMDQEFLEAWLLINVIVAFLHYAYDGLIWRSPRTQQSSGATASAAPDTTAVATLSMGPT